MKILLMMGMLLMCGLFVSAQTTPSKAKCDLTLEQSPTVRGLKLGMADTDAGSILQKPFKPVGKEGSVMAASANIPNGADRLKDGVDFVSVTAYDGRVSAISVLYGGIEWTSDQEFVENFSPKLKLPLDAWTVDGSMGAEMQCRDFKIRLRAESSNLILEDSIAAKSMSDRRKNAENAAKKAIKP